MYKRVLTLLMAAMLLLSMAACGTKKEPSLPEETPTPTPETTLPPGVAENVFTEEDFLEEAEESTPIPVIETEEAEAEDSTQNDSIEDTPDIPSAIIEPVDPDSIGHTPNATAYEQYNNMSGTDQMAFMESFDSVEAFVAWYGAAQAEYNAVNNPIEITNGTIDLGELLGETAE